MGICEDCWCLGRWASGGRDAGDWETLRAAYARYCRYLLLPALWPAQAMLACRPWVIRYRVRPRQWNPATRGMVAGFSRGHPAAIGPIEPCQPILILGASWYLPTCQPSAISPGWHHWSAQTLFCRGFVVPEKREVYPVPRDYWDGVLFSQGESPRRRFLLHNEVRRPVTSRHVRPLHSTVPCYLPWQDSADGLRRG